jgi:hypothetical protein
LAIAIVASTCRIWALAAPAVPKASQSAARIARRLRTLVWWGFMISHLLLGA